jgi:hypothetical protein
MGPTIFTGEYLFAKNKGLLQQNCNIWITNRSNPNSEQTTEEYSYRQAACRPGIGRRHPGFWRDHFHDRRVGGTDRLQDDFE